MTRALLTVAFLMFSAFSTGLACNLLPRSSSHVVITIQASVASSNSPQTSPSASASPAPSSTDVKQVIRNNLDKVLVAVLSVLGTLIVVYFQKVTAKIGVALQWIWKRFKVQRALEGRYRKNLAKELRSIQILQMAEAKDLETIYIPLRLGEWVEPTMKDSSAVLNQKTVSLNEALKEFQRITIVGGPGSGKTTITSHMTASIADHSDKELGRRYFPIYVQLRRLKEFLENESCRDKSLRDLLIDVLEHHGLPEPRKLLERHLGKGSCLLVLDGFDELADETGTLQLRLAQKVTELVALLEDNDRIIMTSRAAGYEPAWFGGFNVLEMTELTLPQVLQFVNGWFVKDQARGKSLQDIIETNERLQLLVASPLMLAIVCFVYQSKRPDDQFLPTRRVDLYEHCVKTLVTDWDKSRGVNRKPVFSPTEIDTVLSHVAHDALLTEKLDFSRKALLALIRPHLPKGERMRGEDELFLNEIMEHTGLFREKARDTIGFIHLTFYEYLAAQVIAEKVLRGAEIKDLKSEMRDVLRNIANPRWFEPISLAAGILKGRSEIVNLLFEEYKTHPTKELRILLAGCLRDADLEKTDIDPDLLLIQDTILSEIVGLAFSSEPVSS
jgi:predicted NACHT family NTPase